MKNFNTLAVALLSSSAIFFAGCNQQSSSTNTESEVKDSTENSIVVNPVENSKQFPGATLKVTSLTAEKLGTDSATLTVKYDVENFTLTEHTEDMNAEHMANSGEGQHIHFILDNKPYDALYKPEHQVKVKLGEEHYLLSFLSRSYHESIKEPNAAVLKHFKVDENAKIVELDAPTEPALFYSRPKGEYAGKDTEKILLDFYLFNTKLDDGHKVEAKVNDQVFVLDQWRPYEIENAPKGELTVTLTLLNAEGNAMAGDNTSITRKVTLKE